MKRKPVATTRAATRSARTRRSRRRGKTVPSSAVTAVLFTCAGQRVDIVTAFGQAGARTIAADAGELAPALYHADERELVPRVEDPADIPTLAPPVRTHDVQLIVPLTDLDHVVLANAREALEPALVLLPSAETCEALGDKWLAHPLFDARRIASPPTGPPQGPPKRRRV